MNEAAAGRLERVRLTPFCSHLISTLGKQAEIRNKQKLPNYFSTVIVSQINLLFVGILAGGELIVRYGLSASMSQLPDDAHIQLRQSLIRRLRILVPIIFLGSIGSGVATLMIERFGPRFGLQCVGLLCLVAFILITLLGTVPINKAVLGWRVGALPEDWRIVIARWLFLDTCRCWLSILAFGLFVTASSM